MKNFLLRIFTILFGVLTYGQVLKPFSPIYSTTINGDLSAIGNNLLSAHRTNNYNGTIRNQEKEMVKVDIDSDVTTHCSSSATFNFPADTRSCSRIKAAFLYWSATFEGADRTKINKVKFKVPKTDTYIDVTGQTIYDSVNANPVISSKPYACFADVTSLIDTTSPEGSYTVANLETSEGLHMSSGYSAGWTLYLIYENPLLTLKDITLHNGFIANRGQQEIDYQLGGFRTPETGEINFKFGMSALEGDYSIPEDYIMMNNIFLSFIPMNYSNTFCSSITNQYGYFTNRIPCSMNTLGYDIALDNIPNPGNIIFPNWANTINMKAIDSGDIYFIFSNVLAIEHHEPRIVLTDQLKTLDGLPIYTQTNLNLGGKYLREFYCKNIGNEIIRNVVLKTVLPKNVVFPSQINLPPGFTYTYNTTTRELNFKNSSNISPGNNFTISMPFEINGSCSDYKEACSSSILNQTFASFEGLISTTFVSDMPSSSEVRPCNMGTNGISSYNVRVSDCGYNSKILLCDKIQPVILDPKVNGYTSFVWKNEKGEVLGNQKTLAVNNSGKYTVECSALYCNVLEETFEVSCNPNLLISQEGTALKASLNSNNYIWMDCNNSNSIIDGETNQYFTPQKSGTYAVSVLNDVGETITSPCFNFRYLNSTSFNAAEFKIYPMPVQNEFSIEGVTHDSLSIEILNMLGQKVKFFEQKQEKYAIDDLTNGNYLLKIKNGNSISNHHLIKL